MTNMRVSESGGARSRQDAAVRANALTARPYRTLAVVYIVSVLAHCYIALQSGIIPSVMDDEMLYMQLAKSLFAGEGIMLRGQMIRYPYILYPLCIAPLFGLPNTVNLYQAIIVVNTFAIHLAIYPVYALCAALTGKRGVALGMACVTVLMPDMLMAKHVMAESVAYPLLLFALYLMYRRLRAPRGALAGMGLGVVCFLLYLLKPGYIAPGIAFVLVALVCGILRRKFAYVRLAVWTILTAGACVYAYAYAARIFFPTDAALETVYATQSGAFSVAHVWQCIVGAFKYLNFTTVAFGMLPVAAMLCGLKRFRGKRRAYLWVLFLTLLFMLLGAGYVVYFDEIVHTGGVPSRAHIRYVSFLLPVLTALLCTREFDGYPMRAGLGVCMGALWVGSVSFPMTSFAGSARYVVDSPSLSAMLLSTDGWDGLTYYLPVFLACAGLFAIAVARWGLTARLRGCFMGFLVILLVVNHAAMITSDRYAMDAQLDADAAMVSYLTENDAVYVCDDGMTQDYATIALEARSRLDIRPVTISAMVDSTDAYGAVAQIWPAPLTDRLRTAVKSPYPKPEYLVIEPALLERLRVDDAAMLVDTAKYANYVVYRLPDDGKWLHSGLFGLNDNWVWTNSSFALYDRAIRASGEVTLWLKTRAGTEGASLTMRGPDAQTYTFSPSVDAQTQWIQATFAVRDPDMPFVVTLEHENGNIYIETYAVEGAASTTDEA